MYPLQTIDKELFTAGSSRLDNFHHHLVKLDVAAILFCREGCARFIIDLKEYRIVKNTQVVLLPRNILDIAEASPDFRVSYFCFSILFLQEASIRLEPSFFAFLKENPCYTLPEENTGVIHGLMCASEAIYKDSENRFRSIIAKNHLQNFLLEVYDKTQRWFINKQVEGANRQESIFKRFIALVHEHCTEQREVRFYADKLFITSRYLSTIVQNIAGITTKEIINKHVLLEIKALLQSTDLSLQEISNQLNFPDQSFFGRFFKKHTGMSPTEYRKMG